MRAIVLGLALMAGPGSAQISLGAAEPPAPIMSNTGSATEADVHVLRAGTPIPMRTMVELTTKKKKLRVGARVPLEVAESVRLQGQVVIPSGSPGMAEVTDVRNKGMWGKSGAISLRVLYVRVGERQLRLSGTVDDKGKTGTGAVVASVAFLWPAGFFTTGTSAMIPVGAPIPAFLDEDVPVKIVSAAAEPVVVVETSPR